jgi:hypothetical protein
MPSPLVNSGGSTCRVHLIVDFGHQFCPSLSANQQVEVRNGLLKEPNESLLNSGPLAGPSQTSLPLNKDRDHRITRCADSRSVVVVWRSSKELEAELLVQPDHRAVTLVFEERNQFSRPVWKRGSLVSPNSHLDART